MNLRKATLDDVSMIMNIIDLAKLYFKSNGIDQWQNGYPDEEILLIDIEHQRGYFLCAKDQPLAYFCLDFAGDALYETLQGEWLSKDTPYAALHRAAMGIKARGKGYGTALFQQAEELTRQAGMKSIKIDTNPENKKMQYGY